MMEAEVVYRPRGRSDVQRIPGSDQDDAQVVDKACQPQRVPV
jgi:hypothetical protein